MAGLGDDLQNVPTPPTTAGVDSPAFRDWFRGSRVVDREGRPLVVFHGTPTHGEHANNRYVRMEQAHVEYPRFTVFDTQASGASDSGWLGKGSYFTPDPEYAFEFGNFIMPVYVALQNPFAIHDDDSSSNANRVRFLRSIQHLDGLPEEMKIDLSIPPDSVWVSPRGERVPQLYDLHQSRDEKGRMRWSLTCGETRGTGIVEGTGDTPEEAVFDHRYRYAERFQGFILHLVQRIGADRFTQILKGNGFDGVIEWRPPYQTLGEREWQIKEVVAFSPSQIKSALGNTGAYSPDSEDILLKQTDSVSALKDWAADSALPAENGMPTVYYRGERSGLDFDTFDRRELSDAAFFFTPDRSYAAEYAHDGQPRAFYLRAQRVLDLTSDTAHARAFVREWAKSWNKEGWVDRQSGEPVDPWDVVEGGALWDFEGDASLERWRDLQGTIDVAGYDAALLPCMGSGRVCQVVIVFSPDQIKSADRNCGLYSRESANIFLSSSSASSSSASSSGMEASSRQAFAQWFDGSAVVGPGGAPLAVYHGGPEIASIEQFDPLFTGAGNDALGSGFYFTSDPAEASGYAHADGEGFAAGVLPVYLSIRNPLRLASETLAQAQIDLTEEQAYRILSTAPRIREPDGPLADWFEIGPAGPTDRMIRSVAAHYAGASLAHLEGDFFGRQGESQRFRQSVREVLGFDGVETTHPNGTRHYVAWFPEQVKSIFNSGAFNPADPRILMRATGDRSASTTDHMAM